MSGCIIRFDSFRSKVLVAWAVSLLLTWAAAAVCQAGPNLYPDPGFESSGVSGVARTGEKAGYLKVDARNHWAAIGGRIEVEPFAKYRVTGWVRGRVGSGQLFAPYCYEWDNYEWAFVSAHTIQTLDRWTQTAVTFISPHATMYVHPLAYIDAENCEAWVDDVVVEKIAEPLEAMEGLAAKASRTDSETQILARWYIRRGDVAAAERLMRGTTGEARADIACLIAQHTKDLTRRRPFIMEMIASGGPMYNNGLRRLDEITTGMSETDKLKLVEAAARLKPDSASVKSYRRVLEASLAGLSGPLTLAEAARKLKSLRSSIARLKVNVPADSPAAKELRTAMQTLESTQKEVDERKASLGRCKIYIGGGLVRPDTHAIVIPDKPTLQEEHAAKDLAYHLELITGHALPVVRESKVGKATPILVGKCRLARKLDPSVNFGGLGTEGIHLKTAGPALILAGNRRGVLYATYTFLEDYLGCRWFTPDCATWPQRGTIRVPEIDKRYIPPLEYRGTDYPCSLPADYSVRNRYNGGNHRPDGPRGGHVGVHSLAHTFNGLVPPEKYFATHPEYYSEIDGKRVGAYTQLCLTNPDVLRIATESVRRWIRENPDKTIFSVSQNDWWNYCTCAKCNAVAEEEGSQSGLVVRFINAIADAIKDEFPNVVIETLAYQYTRKPPKITKPGKNVIICLCSIECCFIHPLATDPFNKSFVEDIRGWNRICNRLYIWDYVINYAHSVCPFPNLYVLKPNIDFFIKNGVKGIYEEACYYTKGSEMQELRAYLMAKTLWDPHYDTDKAIAEFCSAYYGPAGRYIRQYINLIHRETQKDPKLHVAIYTHPKSYVTPDMIAKAKDLFDRAEAAVPNDPTRLHRVQVARLPIMYAEIALATADTFAERDGRLVQTGGTDVPAIADRFEKIARAEGLTMIREGGPDATLDAWLDSIRRGPREVQIQKLSSPALEISVLPELGGRIWRIRGLPEGRDLLKLSGKEGAWIPTEGGYEEYSESGYRAPGWNEPYRVTERSERAITLEANLRNGYKMTRRIELDAEKPLIKVTSTLTNTSDSERTSCLRIHPEFLVTSTRQAKVRILRADGSWRTEDLANPADPGAEKDIWLRGDDVPAGKWALVDETAGWTIVNRVPESQIGQCLLNWKGSEARVNLELYSPEVKLESGESITIEHTYQIERSEAISR